VNESQVELYYNYADLNIFVFGPDEDYASITEKSRWLVVVSK